MKTKQFKQDILNQQTFISFPKLNGNWIILEYCAALVMLQGSKKGIFAHCLFLYATRMRERRSFVF